MGEMRAVYKVTKQLDNHLHEPLPSADDAREDYLDIIDFLLEKRGLMMASFKSAPSTVEPSIAKEMVEMNDSIEEKIRAVKAQIGRDLNQTRARLHVENRYTNAFSSPTLEGIYFDKKN
ncbi:hypothetical protein HUG15_21500 [Salicibibacter cibarius]|uniref:Flagellar protein FliT n=1 Tax=Salicibibacter cibarius TaxID=2743000 RepID=A0A7T7CDD5_9BACI|nr:hypothetical protein [Salicibibacter cibarius]QQK77899.1 hypothetical protein HUG15_21500 [Salicibibacter cibarius]